MEYNFLSGNEEQKRLWKEAVSHLLHLPGAELPLVINVSFVPPGELIGHGHTDLALTTWTYGSQESATQVRNDAPGFGGQQASLEALAASFGLPYSPTKHFHETAIHELGHSAFAALPEENRVAIAQMFGAKSDDITELSAGAEWQDRIIEGIAETFKEAFLPRRYRVFPNRTNRRISYSQFPEFRRLFRVSREVEEEESHEANEPFPVDAGTIGYTFPFPLEPWLFEFPLPEEIGVTHFIQFRWIFEKWLTKAGDPTKIDQTFFEVNYFWVYDGSKWNFGDWSGSGGLLANDSWVSVRSLAFPSPLNEGRWIITPALPKEPAFSGEEMGITNSSPWKPPTTFGESFVIPEDGTFFHWEGGSFVSVQTRLAAGQSIASIAALLNAAYPVWKLDGADIFRLGGEEPPDGPFENAGLRSYRIAGIEGPEETYAASFGLPTKGIIVPGEERVTNIPVPPPVLEPQGASQGAQPSRRPIIGNEV